MSLLFRVWVCADWEEILMLVGWATLHRTFQLGFIFAIVIGLGVGETLFGRFAGHGGGHHA